MPGLRVGLSIGTHTSTLLSNLVQTFRILSYFGLVPYLTFPKLNIYCSLCWMFLDLNWWDLFTWSFDGMIICIATKNGFLVSIAPCMEILQLNCSSLFHGKPFRRGKTFIPLNFFELAIYVLLCLKHLILTILLYWKPLDFAP